MTCDFPKASIELLYFKPNYQHDFAFAKDCGYIEDNLMISALPYTICVILGQLNFSLSFNFIYKVRF